MKLRTGRREPGLKAMEALGETREPLHFQFETLQFVQPGDKELLEQCVLVGDWHRQYAGQTILHLVYGDVGLAPKGLEMRKGWVNQDRFVYETALRARAMNKRVQNPHTVIDLLNMVSRVFPFTDQFMLPIEKPDERLWNEMVEFVQSQKTVDTKALWYSMLLTADVERFLSLDLSTLQEECLAGIKARQTTGGFTTYLLDLINLLRRTRMIFPELIGPQSLEQRERERLYALLETARAPVAQGGDINNFLEIFYSLVVVSAPQLTVDATGIHLFPQTGSLAKAPELPIRPEVI